MTKLSLSDVSKNFNVSRSTLYRAIKEGRISRRADGFFDVAEVVRCFGDNSISKEVPLQHVQDNTQQQLIEFLKSELEEYKKREKRYLDQIDRYQLLIEHKESHETSAKKENNTFEDTDYIDKVSKNTFDEAPMTHITGAPWDEGKKSKKGLLNRLLKAAFNPEN